MSAEGFAIQWLKDRFAYDNKARNPEVEKAFLDHFRTKEKLNIVDIGSGIGANCIYFMERLFKHQNWILVEKDESLYRATFASIKRFLEDYNFFYTVEENTFRIKIWESRVKIILLNASFFDIKELIDFEQTDILMAAAVFDLLSEEQINTFLAPLSGREISLFTTMNYQSMQFLPETDIDRKIIEAYEQHMQRPQPVGAALGPRVSKGLEAFFYKKNIDFRKGESTWNLDEKAKKMHKHLLKYMYNSLLTHSLNPLSEDRFQSWYQQKQKASELGELKMEVVHQDYFCRNF